MKNIVNHFKLMIYYLLMMATKSILQNITMASKYKGCLERVCAVLKTKMNIDLGS